MSTVIFKDFIAGDSIIGKGYDVYNRRGRVAESHASLPKSKIMVVWDDGIEEVVFKKSIQRFDGSPSMQMEKDGDDSSSSGDLPSSAASEDASGSIDSDTSSESTETGEDEEVEDHSNLDMENDEESVPGEVSQPTVQVVVPTNPESVGSGRSNGGRGPSNGGRGRGRGRGSGRGPYQQPPPPSSLHAVMKKGSWSRPPQYQVWSETDLVTTNLQAGFNCHSEPTVLNWRHKSVRLFHRELDIPDGPKCPLQYFFLFFPMQKLPSIVEHTNAQMEKHRRVRTSAGEILKFFGIRLVIALNPRKSNDGLQSYWACSTSAQQLCTPSIDNFQERFKMSFTRFKVISECLRLDAFDDQSICSDPYKPIDSFIAAFNDRRECVVTPGICIVPDECMSPWKGLESISPDPTRIHVTKIPRKPRGIGVEMKCSADGESCIMLRLEIQKGASAPLQQFQTAPDNIPFHCAVVLRLVLPWIGTGRLVVADAAFTSLRTCAELLLRGLFFIGVLKGCSKGFPVAYLEEYQKQNPARGAFKVITTSVSPDPSRTNQLRKVMAVLHAIKNKKIRTVIGTYSSPLLGAPHKVVRHRVKRRDEDGVWIKSREVVETTRPKIVEEGATFFNAVDMNDRYRQGYLNMEDSWHTHKCWIRIFTTVLGIVFTDSYLGYKLEEARDVRRELQTNERDGKLSFFGFLSELAHGLIFNKLDEESQVMHGLRSHQSSPGQVPSLSVAIPQPLYLNRTSFVKRKLAEAFEESSDTYQRKLGSFQLRCVVCKKKASQFCDVCSRSDIGQFVVCCSSKTDRNCWKTHIDSVHGNK